MKSTRGPTLEDGGADGASRGDGPEPERAVPTWPTEAGVFEVGALELEVAFDVGELAAEIVAAALGVSVNEGDGRGTLGSLSFARMQYATRPPASGMTSKIAAHAIHTGIRPLAREMTNVDSARLGRSDELAPRGERSS